MVINYICYDCGEDLLRLPENSGKKRNEVCTMWVGKCDICDTIKNGVCSVRDYRYPSIPAWFVLRRRSCL